MKSKELKTGIFVIVTLLAVTLMVNYLRGNGFFQKSHTFYTSYTDVQGLNPATPVYINGFKAGSVTEIKFNKENKLFDIKLNVSGDFDIPSDSRTEIFSSDILGGKSIRIIYGTGTIYAKTGDIIPGSICEDPLSAIMAGIGPIMIKIDTLAASLITTVNGINSLLNQSNRDDITALINNFRKSSENIESLTSSINDSSPEIKEIIANLKELSRTLKESSIKLDSTLANAEDITDGLRNAGLKETIENIDSLIQKLQDPEGSIGKMMSTDSLHNSVNSLVNDIDSLVNKIKDNPRKNLKISVF